MRKRLVAVLVVALTLIFGTAAFAQSGWLEYNEAIVGLDDVAAKDANIKDIAASRLLLRSKKAVDNFDDYGVIAVAKGPDNHYALQFATADDAKAAMEALSKDKNIKYVQQDGVAKALEAAPKGFTYNSWGVQAMGSDELVRSIKSAGSVTVAVLDTGVGMNSFLNDRVKVGGADFTDPTNQDGRNDVQGHGTHVAGTIVDVTQGAKVNILPVRVLGDDGLGYDSWIANGMRYAADMGCEVANMSLGGVSDQINPYTEYDDAVDYAMSKGMLVVVSAGNDDIDTRYTAPACVPDAVTVAAVTPLLEKAIFSNFGDAIDVAAPGTEILSCRPGGGFTSMQGTSMAAPHISGIAALVKLAHPGFSPKAIDSFIKSNCKDLGAEGWDKYFGYGIPYFVVDDQLTEADFTARFNGEGMLITGYTGQNPVLTIPETISGKKVIGVDAQAFLNNDVIEEADIPGFVEFVGESAFSGCHNLKKITLQPGVKRLGNRAFYDCRNLSDVSLGTVTNIDGNVFTQCISLNKIELPDTLVTLGQAAFNESGIESITVPGSVNSISPLVFGACQNLTSVTLMPGVGDVGTYFIKDSPKIESISLPESVKTIAYKAFAGSNVKSVDMPGVENIEESAFETCSGIESMTIPEGVEYIGNRAFAACPNLKTITFPKSIESFDANIVANTPVETIRGYTGSIAEQLAIYIGVKFESLGYKIQVTNLTTDLVELYLERDELFTLNEYNFEPYDASDSSLLWTSSDETVAIITKDSNGNPAVVGKAAGIATITGTTIDGSNLSISIDVTVLDSFVRGIRIDKTELSLNPGATQKLTATVYPDTVTEEDGKVVWSSDDESIATVDETGLVTAVKTGETNIIASCLGREWINTSCKITVNKPATEPGQFITKPLENGEVMIIGYSGSETEIEIPSSIEGAKVTSVGEAAFEGKDIKTISIPEGVETIESRAFADCKKLKSVTLPESLIHLANDAFKGCKSLKPVKSLSLRIVNDGEGYFVTPVFKPNNTASTYKMVLSSNKAAVISDYGYLEPKTSEYFTLTVKAGGKSDTIGFAGGQPYAATSVSIKGKAKRTVKVDKTISLSYVVKPKSAKIVAAWQSSNPDVATVDGFGVVTGVSSGKATITLVTDLGFTDKVVVTVK